MVKGSRRTKIPKEILPNIIKTCIKNYQRHRNDSKILFENNSYPSAVTSLLYSVEELAKVLLLLPYYKRKEDVHEDYVRKLFRDHQYRFQEFQKYFHQSLPSNSISTDMTDSFTKMIGSAEQDYKEKMIYVDWIDNRIHDPTYLEQFMITNESDAEHFVKAKFEFTKIDINQVLYKLSQDPDVQTLLNEKDVDLPTNYKLIQIVKEYFGSEKVPIQVEMKGKQITIKLDSKHRLVTEEIKKTIRNDLQTRYPDYDLIIILV